MRSPLALAFVLIIFSSAHAAEKDGWIELFDGKTLDGWVVDGPLEFKDKADGNKPKPLWSVHDGLIRTSGAAFGFLRYKTEFADFRLHVEYRLIKEKGANSGLGIRTGVFDPKKSTETRPSFFSYEVQLLDDAEAKPTAHTTASLYRYVAPTKVAHKPAPEWNSIEIECVGPKIKVAMNGTDILEFDQSKDEKLKSKPLRGYVCLQSHSKQAEFKNVRVKPLAK